ncbi:hypothetical protein BDW66DRAFT_128289 [Aspergillus desertorum]
MLLPFRVCLISASWVLPSCRCFCSLADAHLLGWEGVYLERTPRKTVGGHCGFLAQGVVETWADRELRALSL